MSSQRRRYTLKARAEQHAETRQRIVEATSQLHREVGPAQTTVAEIARRAGVQRLTVYNHFADESGLFSACSAHWLAHNPPPDPKPALGIEDPHDRLRAILGGLYRYYRATEEMAFNIQRDRLVIPALDRVVREGADARLALLADALTSGLEPEASKARRLRPMVSLALDFWTWRRLKNERLDDAAAAALMVDAIFGAIDGQPPV